ncbi:MAG: polyisoprenoid-binding protein [Rhodanobacter sp.]|nr:MAG: polyisoprenoid-binding protein [Rhodanobacter sp.]
MKPLLAVMLLAGLAFQASATAGEHYRIDTAHSHAGFEVRLLWFRTISGRFARIDGTVSLNGQGMAIVDARIDSPSVVMDSPHYRKAVLGPKFFDAAQHPVIHFLSDPVAFTALRSGGVLDGQLSLRGITRPVRFELLASHCTASAQSTCKIRVRGRVSRKAFGMTSHRTVLSDRVTLELSIALEPAIR